MNVVGGYVVTDRMLEMFKPRAAPATRPRCGTIGDRGRPRERLDTHHALYLIGASSFVLGLHLMNSPASARRGNQLSAAGMTVAIATTVLVLVQDRR